MQRVEDSLNLVLERFRLPIVEQVAPEPFPEETGEVLKEDPYTYQPLDFSRCEFRLLDLYSSKEDLDPVRCTLPHFGFEDDVKSLVKQSPYAKAIKLLKALSYTWGDVNKKGSIVLEGHEFPVTENLLAALRHLCNVNREPIPTEKSVVSYWWIDAICINQDNILERNEQVSLMTRIYKKASGATFGLEKRLTIVHWPWIW
jgi:hypothetical protein